MSNSDHERWSQFQGGRFRISINHIYTREQPLVSWFRLEGKCRAILVHSGRTMNREIISSDLRILFLRAVMAQSSTF